VDDLIGGIVGDTQLLSDLADGEFQFEGHDEAQPLSCGKISPVDPSVGEIEDDVAACGAATPFIGQPVQFSDPAPRAKSLMVFKAKSQQIFSGQAFGFYQTIICG